ncbi:hypothetical protein [Gordonia alkaliphila]|uniref:Uncharacterized protein n=1 Tax=Gordonia alkaliphila TaxID=1053547 RepID=A0ABP8Z2X5_9ACTN
MSSNPGLTVHIDPEDFDDFEAECDRLGVEVEEVRSVGAIIESMDSIMVVGGFGAMSLRTAQVTVRGSLSNVRKLDLLFDRRSGAHIIYTGPNGSLADARNRELEYGLVRVIQPRGCVDILAKDRIHDSVSRLEFVGEVKSCVECNDDLRDIANEISDWDGVSSSEFTVAGLG